MRSVWEPSQQFIISLFPFMLTQHSFIVIHIHAFAFIFIFVFVFIQWLLHTLLLRLVLFYCLYLNRISGLFHLLVRTCLCVCVFVTCLSGSLKRISVSIYFIYLVVSCVLLLPQACFLIIFFKPLKMQEEKIYENYFQLWSKFLIT